MELKSVFAAYGERPFLFMWTSVLYVFFSLVVFFATIGILLFSSLALFLIGYPLSFENNISLALYGVALFISLLFLVYMNGCITAATVYALKKALNGSPVSLVDFYHYGLSRGPMMFSIGILRDFFMFITIGVGVAVYFYGLQNFEYGIHLLVGYSAIVFFFFHLLTKPGLIACGLGDKPFEAFKRLYTTFVKNHIYFLLMFCAYAFVWLLNFVPLLQFISLLVLYPLSYSALVKMVDETK